MFAVPGMPISCYSFLDNIFGGFIFGPTQAIIRDQTPVFHLQGKHLTCHFVKIVFEISSASV